ncbi:ankyrin repeat domain-containing protein [Nocardia sp. NPDC051030]|uniref:ankyrin repeat domain-containing protein n=1 Tax=Nocardia sp. NPDC051030 TaxID=3155162 RepID=UPI0034215CEF
MRENHPIIQAAEAGDLEQVTEMLDAAPELVNVRGWMNITPLIAATWRADSAPLVRELLERGADPLAHRDTGDNALHWAASGAVAELLAAAAGSAGLTALYLEKTPLHVALSTNRADVVHAFLAAGADLTTLDRHGRAPLDMAATAPIARMLIEAGAAPQTKARRTPLHLAAECVAADADWVAVSALLLDRGADPALRDEFGALPSDLLRERGAMGQPGARELHDRMLGMVRARGRSVHLDAAEVAVASQTRVAAHPERPEALTSLFAGTVLVRWRLEPVAEPIEVIRISRRTTMNGPYGASAASEIAFADRGSVQLRRWAAPRRFREVSPALLPDRMYANPALSPDGRFLAAPSCEQVHLIDLERGEIVCKPYGFGDWSVEPRFSPDGKLLAVGNSMQGSWWLTVMDVADDGTLSERYELEDDLPTARTSEIISDLAFTPDGTQFATWVRPDYGRGRANGYRGLVATTWTHTGDPAWHLLVDDEITGAPGQPTSASLCFTPDGAWLAIGLDSGVLWLDAETGTVAGRDNTVGAVNDLAAHHTHGMLAATTTGLRHVEPPTRTDS